MKKMVMVAIIMIMAVAMAGGAYAAPPLDVQVNVNATVTQKCVVATPGALDIVIDPTVSGNQAFIATQPSAKCTKTKGAATAAVSATSLNTFNLAGTAGEADIPYTFTFNPTVVGNGFGAGADVDFGIGGYVAEADANVAEYGSYTDTITMTLAY